MDIRQKAFTGSQSTITDRGKVARIAHRTYVHVRHLVHVTQAAIATFDLIKDAHSIDRHSVVCTLGRVLILISMYENDRYDTLIRSKLRPEIKGVQLGRLIGISLIFRLPNSTP